jgi:HPr kinase/phosphorylase
MVYTPSLTVGALIEHAASSAGLDITVVAGAKGLERRVTIAVVQKTGLALAGFDHFLRPGRLLVFGDSELSFLAGLARAERRAVLRRAFAHDLPGVLITGTSAPLADLAAEADHAGLPLLHSPLPTPVAMTRLTTLLEDRLAPRDIVHGVLMDILGLGVLVTGESGIGKSECALDLVVRGHRLVADDAVEIRRRAEAVLIGSCPELTRHHMEIRGIGLINVRDMFGVASTRSSKRVEFVVQLERWDPAKDYERLGLDEDFVELIGLRVPMVRMPVAPGRSLAILVEVAARNQLLRSRGQHAARRLVERADRRLAGGPGPRREETDDPIDLEEDR